MTNDEKLTYDSNLALLGLGIRRLITRAMEDGLSSKDITNMIKAMQHSITKDDSSAAKEIVDHLYP